MCVRLGGTKGKTTLTAAICSSVSKRKHVCAAIKHREKKKETRANLVSDSDVVNSFSQRGACESQEEK